MPIKSPKVERQGNRNIMLYKKLRCMLSVAIVFIAVNLIGCGDSNDEPSTSSLAAYSISATERILGIWNHEDYTSPKPGHKNRLTITKDKIVQEISVEAPIKDATGQIMYQIQNFSKECLYEIDEDDKTIHFYKSDGTLAVQDDVIYEISFRGSNELVFSYKSEVGNPYNAFTYIRTK